jgi:ankyrin repeat protein
MYKMILINYYIINFKLHKMNDNQELFDIIRIDDEEAFDFFMKINPEFDVNIFDDDLCTPLHFATFHHNKNIIEKLLILGAKLHNDCDGENVVQLAYDNGHNDIVELFLEHFKEKIVWKYIDTEDDLDCWMKEFYISDLYKNPLDAPY